MPTATHTATATPTPRIHVVERGDNPSFIADTYGVSVEDLMAINNIEDESGLQVGQELIIPGSAPPGSGDEVVEGPTPAQVTYEVKGGDTLLAIALDHGTTVEAIVAANPDTNTDLIYPGEMLVVPLATPTITPTPAPPPTSTPTPGPLYEAPALLTPTQGQVIQNSTLLFNWTVGGVLARDEFYVLELTWADGSQTEYWLKNSSWRITSNQRPAAGPVVWQVSIKRQTGADQDGSPQGLTLISSEQRTIEWP
jgi:LysM repeat protein